MKQAKSTLSTLTILIVISALIAGLTFAKPNFVTTTHKSGKDLFLPENAIQVAPNVFSLGEAIDVDGRAVEGFLFTKQKENARAVCGNGVCEKGENANKCAADCSGGNEGPTPTSTCYTEMAKGAKWRVTEPYVVDTATGVDFVLTQASLEVWDSQTGFDIFGTGSSGVTDGADENSPDGVNEVLYVNIGPSNTIAYTIVWGVFRGPPQGRELVEWDAVFNTDYPFGDATQTAGVMDYQNIAVHEFGHALGLTHPDGTCTEETMYAYAALDEIKKRTLESGDLAGLASLYG